MLGQKTKQSEQTSGQVSFRRNQTLSSYKHTQDDTPSARRQAREISRLRRRLWSILTGVILVVAILIFFLAQFISRLSLTTDNGPATLELKNNTSQYEKIIADYFSKNPLERLNFVLKPGSLLSFIQQQAPEVESIEVRDLHGIPGQASLHLIFRQPVAKWTINQRDYYVDGAGRTFTNNYFGQPALIVVDENSLSVKQGVAIASNRLLESIGQSVNEFGALGLKVTKITIPRGMMRQFDISLDGMPYMVKLSTDRSAAEQAEDTKRVVDYLRLSGLTPGYIDVRIAGRVYYK